MNQVLFITYYYPPSAGPGVQRALKFIKYLSAFGWQPTVLTVDPAFASFPDLDPELESEIPPETRVIRTRARDPYAAYARLTGRKKVDAVGVGFLTDDTAGVRERSARWIRANLFLPDARVGWVRHASAAALKAAQKNAFDAVISTGPPHSSHLVAEVVKKETGLPWIVDIRDDWPDESYAHMLPATRWARARDAKKRKSVYDLADRLVTVSQSLRRSVEKQTRTPVEVVSNGFDPDDFASVDAIRNEHYTIVHAGNMSAERDPEAFWEALCRRRASGDWEHLRIRLVGNVAASVRERTQRLGLTDHVEFVPYVDHATAIRHICGADTLLLPINRVPGGAGFVTGKIFEYLASGNPVVCLGDPDGEAAAILDRSDAGRTHDYDDSEGVEATIDTWYRAWRAGTPVKGASPEAASRYSRKSQTGKMAEILNQIDPS